LMSEMIKRVAKAIYTLRHSTHESQARAVIEAMRDLTDEMDMAGSEALPAPDGHGMPDDFRDAWRAAIDVALKAD